MAKFWNIILVLATYMCFLSMSSADNRKYVESEHCIVAQYCKVENAISELQSKFGMTLDNAEFYVSNNTIERSCSCHRSCEIFDVCCQDYEPMELPENLGKVADRLKIDSTAYTCETLLGKSAVIVNTCPSDAPLIMKKGCANADRERDVYVTSNASFLTYRNIHCALCNGEKYEKLEAWSWYFNCFPATNQSLVLANKTKKASFLEQVKLQWCTLSQNYKMKPPEDVEVYLSIGVYLDSMSFCSSKPISSCPATVSENEKNECTTSPTELITYEGSVYKNQHCLRCHKGRASISSAICESCERQQCEHPYFGIPKITGSFGILVQPYGHRKVLQCETANNKDCTDILDTLTSCDYGEYLDFTTSTCVNVCDEMYYLKDGVCEFLGLQQTCTEYLEADSFQSLILAPNKTNLILHRKTFIAARESYPTKCYTCNYIKDITADTTDFVISSDGNVTFKDSLISPNFVYNVDGSIYFVCLDGVIKVNQTQPTYKAETVITYLLLSLSMISLILYFIAYILFSRLRNVPGKIVLGNMTCLFFAYVVFILRAIPELEDSAGCTVVAILINYFFLASFVFNIVYAGFIVRSLEFIDFESRVNKWTAMRLWAVALFIPLVVITPGFLLDQMTENKYRPQYGGKECFIGSELGQLIYFIAPIGLCLLIAIILYIIIIVKLVQLAKQTSQVRSHHYEKITLAIKLLIVLGFNWIFAMIAAVERGRTPADRGRVIAVLVFIITCTLQGFFGFVVFICNKATLADIKKCINKKKAFNIEMEDTSTTKSRPTTVTDTSKNLLQQVDSTKALLKTNDDVSV